jgi:hypothetical protein
LKPPSGAQRLSGPPASEGGVALASSGVPLSPLGGVPESATAPAVVVLLQPAALSAAPENKKNPINDNFIGCAPAAP